MTSTNVVRRFRAPRASVFAALTDPDAIARWRVPDGMTAKVHEFDARLGGRFRVSLTYDQPTNSGKTSAQTDTYHGYFAEFVPDRRIVEVIEFESTDPALQGTMTVTTTLTDVDGGSELVAAHEGLPPGLSARDNELGWRMSLDKLAKVVEHGDRST